MLKNAAYILSIGFLLVGLVSIRVGAVVASVGADLHPPNGSAPTRQRAQPADTLPVAQLIRRQSGDEAPPPKSVIVRHDGIMLNSLAQAHAGNHSEAAPVRQMRKVVDGLAEIELGTGVTARLHIAAEAARLQAVAESRDGNCDAPEKAPTMQVAFVLDCTGSTSAYLAGLKDSVVTIATDFKKNVEKLSMAFLCFRDHTDAKRFEWAESGGSKWFEDIDGMKTEVAKMRAEGGGDAPEDVAGGMGQALNKLTWTDASNKRDIKILMTISKDKDSKRSPYASDAEQCSLMGDIKVAGIKLLLVHLDNNPSYSMKADTARWAKCYDDSDGAEVQTKSGKIKEYKIDELDVTGKPDAIGPGAFEKICGKMKESQEVVIAEEETTTMTTTALNTTTPSKSYRSVSLSVLAGLAVAAAGARAVGA